MPEPDERETDSPAYAQEMVATAGTRWKQVLNVQAPYRWNVRRLTQGRVLDVGCGIGRNLAPLPNGVGVDHNAAAIRIARAAGLRAWTTEEWPDCEDAEPASFDTLLVAHVLEHLSPQDGELLLQTYEKYLKPEARMVLICPQEKGFRVDPHTHIRFVTDRELAQHADDFGFAVRKSLSFPFPRPAGKLFTYNEFVVVAQRTAA